MTQFILYEIPLTLTTRVREGSLEAFHSRQQGKSGQVDERCAVFAAFEVLVVDEPVNLHLDVVYLR